MPNNMGGGNNPNAWGGGGNNNNNNRNLDMPNLQALGINPGGNQQNQGSNMNNPPMGSSCHLSANFQAGLLTVFISGVGLNLNALPMNPAIVAAALNQWGSAMGGLLNGMQNQGNNDQVSLPPFVL